MERVGFVVTSPSRILCHFFFSSFSQLDITVMFSNRTLSFSPFSRFFFNLGYLGFFVVILPVSRVVPFVVLFFFYSSAVPFFLFLSFDIDNR